MMSAETRENLVRMVLDQDRGDAAVAHDLNMSVRSASRFLGYGRDTVGDFHYGIVNWNRHFDNLADDPQLRDAVLSAIREQPDMFLEEIADAVNKIAAQVDGAVDVTPTTVARVLERNGYTRKVVEKAFFTRNEADRVPWVAMKWQIPLRCRVYVDEAHRVGRAAERRWAGSLRGSRAECYVASSFCVRTSFFVAMAHDCVLDWFITRPPAGQTAIDFLFFMSSFVRFQDK